MSTNKTSWLRKLGQYAVLWLFRLVAASIVFLLACITYYYVDGVIVHDLSGWVLVVVSSVVSISLCLPAILLIAVGVKAVLDALCDCALYWAPCLYGALDGLARMLDPEDKSNLWTLLWVIVGTWMGVVITGSVWFEHVSVTNWFAPAVWAILVWSVPLSVNKLEQALVGLMA